MTRNQVAAGEKFGRLTLVDPCNHVGGRPGWECKCECGVIGRYQIRRLISGHTKSCGCIKADGGATKHGHRRRGSTSPTYVSWQSMIQRCSDPEHSNYAAYRGSGITVCAEWQNFDQFLADMGERPRGTTIDRIDGSIGYQPKNCRWASNTEQANNKRTRKTISANGAERTLKEWSAITGIPASCIHKRVTKLGWPIEAAISTPSKGKRHVQKG